MKTNSPTQISLVAYSVDRLLDRSNVPLKKAHLHPDVVKTVWDHVRKTRTKSGYSIDITVPVEDVERQAEVQLAFQEVFEEEAKDAELEVRQILRQGRRTLLLSLLGVAAILGIAEVLPHLSRLQTVSFMSESLVIVAWVLLWTPVELLVYDHWPVRYKRRQALEIAEAKVRLVRE